MTVKTLERRSGGRGMDTPARYGLVSRVLHWGMAYLLLWQFVMVFSWRAFGDSAVVDWLVRMGPSHGTVGLLTLAFVVVRAAWVLVNRRRRPPRVSGWPGAVGQAVHVAFYLLMLAIPAIALLRAYGNGEGWSPWGIALIPKTGVKVSWMVAPANALHSPLSWLLCGLIAVHILAALYHRLILRDGVLGRMAGLRKAQK